MKKITLHILFICSFFNAIGQTTENNSNEKITIKNLEINSKYQDYGVSVVDSNTVYFTSSRKTKTIRNKTWAGNNQPFLQLYKGSLTIQNEIEAVELLSKNINSKYHDADLTFTKDLSTVYFTRNNYLNKKFKKDTLGRNLNQLYKATIDNKGKWKVQQMPFNNDNYQTGHPALSPNEDKLYFISDMPGGFGLTDIYVVDILENGMYSTPKNLGSLINTPGKEMFPFVNENNLIIFASNGFANGQGGLDLYISRIKDGAPLKKAENMGEPFNSEQDDFAYIKMPNSSFGFFSSNRFGGKGDDDIYSFYEYDATKFDCEQLVTGIVLDENTGKIIPNASVELFNSNGLLSKTVQSDSQGNYQFDLTCSSDYSIRASKEGFSIEQTFLHSTEVYDLENKLDFKLQQSDFIVSNGQIMIKISPIFFELDKSNIRPDAAEILGRVLKIMNKYPDIDIKLGSHTDSRANDEYNWELSKRRASSTLDWLLKNGIDPERISARGFGEFQLVNKCSNNVKCTEAEHQQNRRTEFIVSNPEVLKGKVKI